MRTLPSTFPKYSISEDFIYQFFLNAIQEDIGKADPSSLACFGEQQEASAQLVSKDSGVIAGVEVAKFIFQEFTSAQIQFNVEDGEHVEPKQLLATIEGPAIDILSFERIMLNIMQRMSGIASLTNQFVERISHTPTKLLDTRKTTPNFRYFEKWATQIGGGINHRFALYDMIMLKDNHIDFCGGIPQAVTKVTEFLLATNQSLKIEVETRTLTEVKTALSIPEVDRIMLDNFTPDMCKEAVSIIQGEKETEISGGITLNNIDQYAEAGVTYISTGATIHSAPNFDISLISNLSWQNRKK